jgi:hypothetical protein
MLLRDEWEEMEEGLVKTATKTSLDELWHRIITFQGQFPNETPEDWFARTGMAYWSSYQCPHCKEYMYGPRRTRENRLAKRLTCENCGMTFMATTGNQGNGLCFPGKRNFSL